MKKKHGEFLDCRTSSIEFATDDTSKVASPLFHTISGLILFTHEKQSYTLSAKRK